MKRMRCAMLFALVVVALSCEKPKAEQLNASSLLRSPTSKDAVMVPGGPAVQDAEVLVDGRATLYIIQGRQVRYAIELPAGFSGKLVVPLSKVNDKSGRELYWGVRPGSVVEDPGNDWNQTQCMTCQSLPCCPKQQQ